MSELSEKAIQIAAQCWCDEETQMIEMDTRLATAFAKRLDNDYHAIAELTERNIILATENVALKKDNYDNSNIQLKLDAVKAELRTQIEALTAELKWHKEKLYLQDKAFESGILISNDEYSKEAAATRKMVAENAKLRAALHAAKAEATYIVNCGNDNSCGACYGTAKSIVARVEVALKETP